MTTMKLTLMPCALRRREPEGVTWRSMSTVSPSESAGWRMGWRATLEDDSWVVTVDAETKEEAVLCVLKGMTERYEMLVAQRKAPRP